MNTYLCTDGSRVTQGQIDSRMRKAKANLIQEQFDDEGYNFCRKCNRSTGTYFDCSHIISIQDAKNLGQTEQCWNVNNMRILCRECHQKVDKLGMQFKKTLD